MSKFSKEIKTGFTAVIAVVVLYFGMQYLKGINVFDDSRTFYVEYDDIGGLQKGSSVLLNGYNVGMVGDIDLMIKEKTTLLVIIKINKEFNIPINTVCKIVNQDLMGTKGIALILGNALESAKSGDTIHSAIENSLQEEVNAQILPLKNKAEELIGSVDSVMMIVTAVLNKDTRESLRNSLQSLDKTFSLMSETMLKMDSLVDNNDERISRIIANFESISYNLKGSNSEVKNILTNFSAISDTLAKANIATTLKNMETITTKINNGEGSIGLLMKDDQIYKNLEKTTKELADLIEDIKKHPSRYVNFSIIGGGKPYIQPK